MNSSMIKFAASSLVIAASIAGFSPAIQNAISNDVGENEDQASRAGSEAAAEARAALGSGQAAQAIAAAERAVEAQPHSAEYRHLLGQSYLAAGRLSSAETSFQDALQINPGLDRTAFNLALVQIAQGRKIDARDELDALQGKIGASDLGLAFALAGDNNRAIAMLTDAVRADASNSKARQNLALTYALAGRWGEARVTAAQDVSMAQLDQRMRDWAGFAQPTNSWDQVASLLGFNVNPGDPGQPMRLALAPATPSEVMTADASDSERSNPVVAFATPVETSSPADYYNEPVSGIRTVDVPAPVESAPMAVPPQGVADDGRPYRVSGEYAQADTADGFIVEDEQDFYPVNDPAPSAPAAVPAVHRDVAEATVHRDAPVPTPAASPVRQVARVEEPAAPAPAPRDGDGRYMVQIGAYAREQNVERGWDQAIRKYGALANYTPNRADYDAGQRLYRLAFGGYDSRGAAADMCRNLRANGVQCFVRARAGDMPLQMALRAAREAQQTAAAHHNDADTPQYASVQIDRSGSDRDRGPVRRTSTEQGMMPLEFASDVLMQIAQLV